MKRPVVLLDINALAKSIVDLAIDESPLEEVPSDKNPHAVELGRLGGKKGGVARANKLTKEHLSEVAKKAADVRWSRRYPPKKKSLASIFLLRLKLFMFILAVNNMEVFLCSR